MVKGINFKDIRNFEDIVSRANIEQVHAMHNHLCKECLKRKDAILGKCEMALEGKAHD